jgi:hypothetical protein
LAIILRVILENTMYRTIPIVVIDPRGAAGNYGHCGSIQNYQETLNSALDAATLHMAQSQGFKDAVCHCTN